MVDKPLFHFIHFVVELRPNVIQTIPHCWWWRCCLLSKLDIVAPQRGFFAWRLLIRENKKGWIFLSNSVIALAKRVSLTSGLSWVPRKGCKKEELAKGCWSVDVLATEKAPTELSPYPASLLANWLDMILQLILILGPRSTRRSTHVCALLKCRLLHCWSLLLPYICAQNIAPIICLCWRNNIVGLVILLPRFLENLVGVNLCFIFIAFIKLWMNEYKKYLKVHILLFETPYTN